MATGEIGIIMKIGITDAIVMVIMAAIIATGMAIVESLGPGRRLISRQ